jgi:hypothetical protein
MDALFCLSIINGFYLLIIRAFPFPSFKNLWGNGLARLPGIELAIGENFYAVSFPKFPSISVEYSAPA